MIEKQIDILEKLLSEKVSEERIEEYEKYQKINGASEEELNALEKRYNIKLPKDFREFYKYKNGSGYHFHILYPNCEGEHIEPFYLFSIEEIIEEKDSFYDEDELMSDYYDEEEISEVDFCCRIYIKRRGYIMTIYIALLRGINVGGKNIIKMANLKQMFEAMGFCEVKTYIQSGNVLFKSNEEEELLRKKIEHEIEVTFGFSVIVILRTAAELEQIIENCPFSEDAILEAELSSEGESLYVSLLTHTPSQEKIEYLKSYKSEKEEYQIKGREVFLLFRHSIRKSKLANNLHKLDIPETMRNWKTINKLAVLAKAMES
jgi:uncharacterized protein (DUF1697 family)